MAYCVEKPCITRLEGGRGCPEYALPGKSRCATHEAEFEASRRADPSLTGRRGTDSEWRRARGLALWRAKHTCQECGRHKDDLAPRETLDVHHVDGDPTNHRQSNLLVCCSRCHRALEVVKRAARSRR